MSCARRSRCCRGELELAAKPGRSREELAEAVANAAEEAARLSRITDDLLTLASSDERQLTVRAEPTDLARLLGAAPSRPADGPRTAQVSVRLSVTPGLSALVDADRIRQAVDNLIDNALRFAPPRSRVDDLSDGNWARRDYCGR